MIEIINDDNFIVGIFKNSIFNWYILDDSYFYQKGKKEWEKDDSGINSRIVHTNELTLALLNAIDKGFALEDFSPVIIVDCDKKIIYSQYPEPNDFDLYIDDGWNFEEDIKINNLISDVYKYWIYKNINLFNRL